MLPKFEKTSIAVIGLGYVGLPLSIEFGKKYHTIGYDINQKRVEQLLKQLDNTQEVTSQDFRTAQHLSFTHNEADLSTCNIYIVTVPTPVDLYNQPNLSPLISASQILGRQLQKGNIVIFESTVYPGATEEICVPELEKHSNLSFNKDFYVGYSPERINPGDPNHRLPEILKITSGSTPETAEQVDALYKSIIKAGTHKASSIRVAEAAKVIENTQRDLNIALINELAILFNQLNIDTQEVLTASATKWNFLPFKPGLVGGHCIGVDPYYLTRKAQEIGHHPEVILAGRRTNDRMGSYIAQQVVKLMTQQKIQVVNSNVLVLGLTFKENCPDIRNTRVIDLIQEFTQYNATVDVYDPEANREEALEIYDIELVEHPHPNHYEAIILCVAHQHFLDMNIQKLKSFGRDSCILYDVKSVLPKEHVDGRL